MGAMALGSCPFCRFYVLFADNSHYLIDDSLETRYRMPHLPGLLQFPCHVLFC